VVVAVPTVLQVGSLQPHASSQVVGAGQPVMFAHVTALQPHPPSAIGLSQVGQVQVKSPHSFAGTHPQPPFAQLGQSTVHEA